MWHVKDMHKVSRNYTELGNGTIDYTKIWPDAAMSGMKHFFVEQGGNFAVDAMTSAADRRRVREEVPAEVERGPAVRAVMKQDDAPPGGRPDAPCWLRPPRSCPRPSAFPEAACSGRRVSAIPIRGSRSSIRFRQVPDQFGEGRTARVRSSLGGRTGLVRRWPLPAVERHPERSDPEMGRGDRRGQRLPPPSHFANGNTRDRQGRLLTCEHDTRRSPAPNTTGRSPCSPTLRRPPPEPTVHGRQHFSLFAVCEHTGCTRRMRDAGAGNAHD